MRIVRGLGFLLVALVCLTGCKRDKKAPTAPVSKGHDESVISVGVNSATPARPAPVPAPPDVDDPPSDALRAASGLASKILAPGKGKTHPTAVDRVRVRFTGWKPDGTMFENSAERGEHATVSVSSAIPGWKEALPSMVEGEKRRLWVPAKLAYGDKPTMIGAPSGDLVYDLELVAIVEPPETPQDLKAPPASAKKTESGLVYRSLHPGTGTEHPTADSRVRIHYSGWTADGRLFDSSVVDGAPAAFGLSQVIKGLTEGVGLMVVGEKARFWIPARLAYGTTSSRPAAPAGDLVFDVELLAIEK